MSMTSGGDDRDGRGTRAAADKEAGGHAPADLGGAASGLQPGKTLAGSPGVNTGSLGTEVGSAGGTATGNKVKSPAAHHR
jgi:hypothetical protein